MRTTGAMVLAAMAVLVPPGARAQSDAAEEAAPSVAEDRASSEQRTRRGGTMRQVSPHMGEMLVEMEMPAQVDDEAGEGLPDDAVTETLRFEPWQMLDEMFLRDDVVFVMRHGPTDWSKLDAKDTAPTDCAAQRIMSEEGRNKMFQMGRLMAANDVLPSTIVVSQWCRNQQTLDELLRGFDAVDPAIRSSLRVETDPDLNLLLALQGAPDVVGLRARVEGWDGDPEHAGPLLIITHFTNIEELTTFTVYEGEIIILDPDRDNRVLGYLRLGSAGPDIGHFEVEEAY